MAILLIKNHIFINIFQFYNNIRKCADLFDVFPGLRAEESGMYKDRIFRLIKIIDFHAVSGGQLCAIAFCNIQTPLIRLGQLKGRRLLFLDQCVQFIRHCLMFYDCKGNISELIRLRRSFHTSGIQTYSQTDHKQLRNPSHSPFLSPAMLPRSPPHRFFLSVPPLFSSYYFHLLSICPRNISILSYVRSLIKMQARVHSSLFFPSCCYIILGDVFQVEKMSLLHY